MISVLAKRKKKEDWNPGLSDNKAPNLDLDVVNTR